MTPAMQLTCQDLMTVKEVSTELRQRDSHAVLRLIRSGRLRAYRVGKGFLITREALRDFLESAAVKPRAVQQP